MAAAPLSPLDELVRLLGHLDPDALDHWYGPGADPEQVAAGLARRLRAANAMGNRVCPECDEEQTTCTLCGASLEP